MSSDKFTGVDDQAGSLALVRSLIARAEKRPLRTRIAFGRDHLKALKQHERGLTLAALLPAPGPGWARPAALPVALVNAAHARITQVRTTQPTWSRPQVKLNAKRNPATVQAVLDAQARLYTSASRSNSANLRRTASITS